MQYLNHAIWTALVSGLGAIAGGCLMLPTLARDDMRKTAADTLRAVGVTVSGCALGWGVGRSEAGAGSALLTLTV